MSLLSRIFSARHDDRAELRPLWHRVVALARDPRWYADCGVADTVPGRFDAITLVLALVLLRMERAPALIEPSVRLTELFVDDMDGQLRQSGVGDLAVGKHMGKLMGTLGGRLGALRAALAEPPAAPAPDALVPVVTRNVSLNPGADPVRAARMALAFATRLDAAGDDDVLAGRIAL